MITNDNPLEILENKEYREIYIQVDNIADSFSNLVKRIQSPEYEDHQRLLEMEILYKQIVSTEIPSDASSTYSELIDHLEGLPEISFWPGYKSFSESDLFQGELILLQVNNNDLKVYESLRKNKSVFCFYNFYCLQVYYVVLRLQEPFRDMDQYIRLSQFYANKLSVEIGVRFNYKTIPWSHHITYDPDIYFNPNSLLLPLDVSVKTDKTKKK